MSLFWPFILLAHSFVHSTVTLAHPVTSTLSTYTSRIPQQFDMPIHVSTEEEESQISSLIHASLTGDAYLLAWILNHKQKAQLALTGQPDDLTDTSDDNDDTDSALLSLRGDSRSIHLHSYLLSETPNRDPGISTRRLLSTTTTDGDDFVSVRRLSYRKLFMDAFGEALVHTNNLFVKRYGVGRVRKVNNFSDIHVSRFVVFCLFDTGQFRCAKLCF